MVAFAMKPGTRVDLSVTADHVDWFCDRQFLDAANALAKQESRKDKARREAFQEEAFRRMKRGTSRGRSG